MDDHTCGDDFNYQLALMALSVMEYYREDVENVNGKISSRGIDSKVLLQGVENKNLLQNSKNQNKENDDQNKEGDDKELVLSINNCPPYNHLITVDWEEYQKTKSNKESTKLINSFGHILIPMVIYGYDLSTYYKLPDPKLGVKLIGGEQNQRAESYLNLILQYEISMSTNLIPDLIRQIVSFIFPPMFIFYPFSDQELIEDLALESYDPASMPQEDLTLPSQENLTLPPFQENLTLSSREKSIPPFQENSNLPFSLFQQRIAKCLCNYYYISLNLNHEAALAKFYIIASDIFKFTINKHKICFYVHLYQSVYVDVDIDGNNINSAAYDVNNSDDNKSINGSDGDGESKGENINDDGGERKNEIIDNDGGERKNKTVDNGGERKNESISGGEKKNNNDRKNERKDCSNDKDKNKNDGESKNNSKSKSKKEKYKTVKRQVAILTPTTTAQLINTHPLRLNQSIEIKNDRGLGIVVYIQDDEIVNFDIDHSETGETAESISKLHKKLRRKFIDELID